MHAHGCGLHCLKINNITVRVGDRPIIEDISLHAHCGEITAVIGRNGAGKSTLFRAIIDDLPHSGEVVFSGHNGVPTAKKPRIGYVPQSLNVDRGSPATVLDMALAFTSRWPAFLPIPKRLREDIRTHFARFAAEDLLDKKVGKLSGGELQRTLLAIATRPHPDMLVLDEPVSGMDSAGLALFYSLLDDLRREDMVILLISHDLAYVREHADRVVLMDGRVLECGAPQDVFSSAAFRSAFSVGGDA